MELNSRKLYVLQNVLLFTFFMWTIRRDGIVLLSVQKIILHLKQTYFKLVFPFICLIR